MSVSRRGAARRGPDQIFKKRFLQINSFVGSGGSATNNIIFRETGTIYAVKLVGSIWHDNVAGGVNRVWLSVQHRRAGSGVVLLFSAPAVDVETAELLLAKHGIVRADLIDHSTLDIDEKFRFRRKVDESSVLSLVAESSTTQGTATSSAFSIDLECWLRVR